jgi:hypothetical protein
VTKLHSETGRRAVLQLLLVELGVAAKGVEDEGEHEQPEQCQRQRVLIQGQDQPTALDRAGSLRVVLLLARILVDVVPSGFLDSGDPFWIRNAVSRT